MPAYIVRAAQAPSRWPGWPAVSRPLTATKPAPAPMLPQPAHCARRRLGARAGRTQVRTVRKFADLPLWPRRLPVGPLFGPGVLRPQCAPNRPKTTYWASAAKVKKGQQNEALAVNAGQWTNGQFNLRRPVLYPLSYGRRSQLVSKFVEIVEPGRAATKNRTPIAPIQATYQKTLGPSSVTFPRFGSSPRRSIESARR